MPMISLFARLQANYIAYFEIETSFDALFEAQNEFAPINSNHQDEKVLKL